MISKSRNLVFLLISLLIFALVPPRVVSEGSQRETERVMSIIPLTSPNGRKLLKEASIDKYVELSSHLVTGPVL